jgi:outer membrane lipoprotein-sorting protein
MKPLSKILLILLLLLLPINSQAVEFTEAEMAKIKKAEDYINNITTMTANFTQISPYSKVGADNISISDGKVYLSRPGNALWEYSNPVKQVIHINNHKLIYHDKELEQVSYIDLDEGLSSFLTAEHVNFFNGKFKVVSFNEDKTGFNVVLQDDKGKDSDFIKNEQLKLTFIEQPFELHRFNFKDVRGYVTTVEFNNLVLGASIDKKKFVFKNPKIGKNAWERK